MRVAPNCAAASRRTADGSETTSSLAPLLAAHATTESPTGPAPTTSTLSPERRSRALHRVEADGEGLDQRAERRIERFGKADRLALVHAHVFGERARAAADPDEVRVFAVRGLAGETREASTASDDRERGHVAAHPPRGVGVGTGRRDHTAELVAHHQAGGHRRAHLEVGAADAAGGHLEHQFAGAGCGVGDVPDLELVVLVQRGSTHAVTVEP